MKKLILGLSSLLILAGCAHSVHEYHATESDSFAGKVIESSSEQFVVMGFTDNTSYVDQAYSQLKAKCPGTIDGINTRYSTSLGFFSWTNKIRMRGYCR